MSNGYENKPNLSCKHFKQNNSDILYLEGGTCICNSGYISSNTGYKISGITIFNINKYFNTLEIGCNANSSGIASISIGSSSNSSGATSISIGCSSNSKGIGSISIGTLSLSNDLNSISIGKCSISKCNNSITIGNSCSLGCNTITLGCNNFSYGNGIITLGNNITNSNINSIGFGWNDNITGNESPSILLSNNISYIYGCGDPKLGLGICNPQARLHIKSTTTCAFRLEDGNQGECKILVSDINGFGKWSDINIISGCTNYIPKYDFNCKSLTNSIIKNDNNVIEFEYSGTTILRPYTLPSNSSITNNIEIRGGCRDGYDIMGNIILRSSNVELVQTNIFDSANIISNSLKGISIKSIYDSVNILTNNGLNLNLGNDNNIDIKINSNNYDSIIKKISNGNLYICGYDSNIDNSSYNGGDIILKGGDKTLLEGIKAGDIKLIGDNIYLCNINENNNNDYILTINELGIISKRINNNTDINFNGDDNYISKFSNNTLINSDIINDDNSIILKNQNIILGDCTNNNSIILKPYDNNNISQPINLIIKSSYNTSNEIFDGCLFLDPGRGECHHDLYIGSNTYNKSIIGIKPEGTYDDIDIYLCSKNNGISGLISNSKTIIGNRNNLFKFNENSISKECKSDLCITGYDTIENSIQANNICIIGGNAYGLNSKGGDIILKAGLGSNILPIACSSYYGRIYMHCLLPKRDENNVLYINSDGAISSGITSTININSGINGININNGDIKLGGNLIEDTNITGDYYLNLISGVKLNSNNGYYISGESFIRTSKFNLNSFYIGFNSSNNNSSSQNNIGIGNYILNNNCSGYDNISIGNYSLNLNYSGYKNIAIGNHSLNLNNLGYCNISIGDYSMYNNIDGCYNLSIGNESLYNNNNGCNNISLGYRSLYSLCNTSNNIGIGSKVLEKNISGNNNIGIGYLSLNENVNGSNNISIGYLSLLGNKYNDNISIGNNSLKTNISGSSNISIGNNSLKTNISGSSNISIGNNSLLNYIKSNNISIGEYSQYNNISGSSNISIGNNSLYVGVSSCNNIAIGYNSLKNNINNNNISIGYNSTYYNSNGYNNLIIGNYGLYCNLTGNTNISIGNCGLYNNNGNNNINIGNCGLYNNIIGCNNISFGNSNLYYNTCGNNNISLGNKSLYCNNLGNNNIVLGDKALYSNFCGCNNIGIGYQVLYGNYLGSTNIAIGCNSLISNYSGNNNISLGFNSLYNNSCGNNNISIGNSSLYNNICGSNNISIGNYGGCNLISNNKLYISNNSSCYLIYGEFDNKLLKIDGDLCITKNACALDFIALSDCRFKNNITNINNEYINIQYKEFYLCDCDNQKRYGVLAQDLIKTNPELIRTNSDGILSVSYIDLIIKEISYLKNKVIELEKIIINNNLK